MNIIVGIVFFISGVFADLGCWHIVRLNKNFQGFIFFIISFIAFMIGGILIDNLIGF